MYTFCCSLQYNSLNKSNEDVLILLHERIQTENASVNKSMSMQKDLNIT